MVMVEKNSNEQSVLGNKQESTHEIKKHMLCGKSKEINIINNIYIGFISSQKYIEPENHHRPLKERIISAEARVSVVYLSTACQ